MVKKVLLGCALPILVVGMLASYAMRLAFKSTPPVERSETVSKGDVEIKVVETGTIEPLKKVDLKSLAGGRIVKLLVEEGQQVQTGQVLAITDPQEIDATVKALQSQLAGARAHLASARKAAVYQRAQTSTGIEQYLKAMDAAMAHLKVAEAAAKVQPDLTRQTIGIAQANLDAARATLKATQDTLNLLVKSTHPQSVVTAQAGYDQALAQSDNAARNLVRQKQLLVKGFVSQSVVDSAAVDADVARAHQRDVKEHLDRIEQANEIEEENAKSQVANSESLVRQTQVALEQAQTGIDPLVKDGDLKSAQAAYLQAAAQLAAARSQKTQDAMRQDDIAAAEADVGQLENQLHQQVVVQGYTTMVSAMTGIVTKRYVELGDVITSGISSFAPGTNVYQVADLATMLVKININEVDINKIRLGTHTEVTTDSVKGVTFDGVVRKIAPAAAGSGTDTSGSGGQTVIRFAVEIRIDHADKKLRPGMTARCTVVVARRRNAVRLPTSCVQGTGSTGSVELVTEAKSPKDGLLHETTAKRAVTVGLRGDDFVEILSGLKPGDRVRPNPFTGPPRKELDMRMSAGS